METIEAECNHCLQKKNGTRFIYWKVTEEYEFYTPFKMLFISLSLGAQSTSNFTHSYNSPPNSSCCSSGVPRNRVSLCLPLMSHRQGQPRLRASALAPSCPTTLPLMFRHVCHTGLRWCPWRQAPRPRDGLNSSGRVAHSSCWTC